MIIRKCNVCGKILDLKDDYFEISEVGFHKGKPSQPYARLEIGDNKNFNMNESWLDYCALDFCVDCFLLEMDKLFRLIKREAI